MAYHSTHYYIYPLAILAVSWVPWVPSNVNAQETLTTCLDAVQQERLRLQEDRCESQRRFCRGNLQLREPDFLATCDREYDQCLITLDDQARDASDICSVNFAG